MSRRWVAVSSRVSGTTASITTAPSASTGTLIQKISLQSTSTRRPPTSGPIASATAEIAAQIPRARACLSFGKTSHTIDSDSGSIAAAPMP